MWHSCGGHTAEAFLDGKPPSAIALWDRLCEMVAECGPYEFAAAKTTIGFMVRTRFAGISALSARGMTLNFWLKQHIDNPRFAKVEHLERRDWLYRVRIGSLDELDEEVQRWLCMAYEVGCQRT